MYRIARESDEPWGGLRVVAVGDFAQLPPVDKSGMNRDWAFNHQVWDRSEFVSQCLKTPVRFIDHDFYSVLNGIRLGDFKSSTRDLLNS